MSELVTPAMVKAVEALAKAATIRLAVLEREVNALKEQIQKEALGNDVKTLIARIDALTKVVANKKDKKTPEEVAEQQKLAWMEKRQAEIAKEQAEAQKLGRTLMKESEFIARWGKLEARLAQMETNITVALHKR